MNTQPQALTRRALLGTALRTTVGVYGLSLGLVGEVPRICAGCIGKKGATYAAFFRGVTNVWGVSRSWIAAGR